MKEIACAIFYPIIRNNGEEPKNIPMEKEKKVLTIYEVSELLRIPASTIYDLAKKGRIRGVKFGKHWRFLEEDILGYFKIVTEGAA